MGKKTKRKEKNKIVAAKSKDKGKGKGKKKEGKAKKKGVIEKPKTKQKQKDLQQQWEKLRQEQMVLAIKYQGVESRAVTLLEHVAQLQLESREVKADLALEAERAIQSRERLNSLEMRETADHDELSSLTERFEEQERLTNQVKSRLEAVERLAGQSERLGEQIEQLQAGKNQMETRVGKLAAAGSEMEPAGQDFVPGFAGLTNRLDDAIQRLQETVGRNQVVETWLENLDRADTDFSLQLGQQQERIQGLMERAEELDHTARKGTESYQSLLEQIRDLSASQALTEKRLLDTDAELQKWSQHLDSKYNSLSARHGRLAAGVLVAVALILMLGAIAYWLKFSHLEQRTQDSLLQIEQVSARVDKQERRLTDQEQLFAASQQDAPDRYAAMPGDWDARLDLISQSQESMDARLKEYAQEQEEIGAIVAQLEEQQGETGRRLEKTGSLLSAVVSRLDERAMPADVAYIPNKVRGRDWLQGLNPKHYTIQIAAAYDKARVSRIATREGLGESMAIYKGEFRQRDWYILVYGDFPSLREAKAAIQSLPEGILAGGPWARNISSIHTDLAK